LLLRPHGPCASHPELPALTSSLPRARTQFKDGGKAYGGYANYWRGPSHFVFKIPEQLSSEEAAPMLCGGVTTYSPLVQNGAGPGTRVGIVGIGGLGHFGLLWAKALGCKEIVAISRSDAKKEDAMKMGMSCLALPARLACRSPPTPSFPPIPLA